MITYLEESKSFWIDGKGYTYGLFVNDVNTLQNVYYGAPIKAEDREYLLSLAWKESPKKNDLNKNLQFGFLQNEIAFFARGDYRDPSVIASREDGAQMSQFEYVSHEIFVGTPNLEGLPQVRRADFTLAITVKDLFSDLQVVLYYTASADNAVLARSARYINTGKQKITLKRAYSFCLELPQASYSRLSLPGAHAWERQVRISPLNHGITRAQSLKGNSSHEMSPSLAILKEGCGEETGECYGVTLCYSGSYVLATDYDEIKPLRIQGGINDTGFEWVLNGGEQLDTPQAFLCYSSGGLGEMSRGYTDFMRDFLICPRYVYEKRPIVINNWEATYFDFNNEKLYPIIDTAAELGIDTFVLDDGWFGKRDCDNGGLGDWFVNEKKLKGGLTAVINHCKEKGLKFGLWFEPEMISEDSDLYRAHPDYAIEKKGVEPVRSRNQLVLDYSRKEVVDHIYNVISDVLKNNDISYVKWDFNRSVTELYSAALPAERQGEFAHRFILGVYDLCDRLTNGFPHIFFEGCCGGGGRYDAGMFYYFPQVWTSDDTDAYERTRIEWGSSMFAPLSVMSCHVSACPNHQTGRITPISARGVVASLGPTGYELDLSILPEAEKAQVKEQVKAYREISDLILKGDLYRYCSTYDGGDYFCVGVVAKDKSEAYIVGLRTHGNPRDYNHYVAIKGLAPEKIYRIEELDVTASGKTFGSFGVWLPRLPDFSGWTWHIKEVK